MTACKSNLKNLGTASEMYSTDNGGHYALACASLTPNYLKTIPTCPSANRETYCAGYGSAASPDNYTVYCEGSFHKNVNSPANYPQFTAVNGLIER